LIKLLTGLGALITALVVYATSQVCNYNSTLDLKQQALRDLEKEIGVTGTMTVTYNKQLDCVAVEDSVVDEESIYNQVKDLSKIVIAVINKDKLALNQQSITTEGKSDEETLSLLQSLSDRFIEKKNQILGSSEEDKDKSLNSLKKEYEELLNKTKTK
tara:strand:+ start:164 stop:637 length:474 start_codon:yes stop_codon:yes gene_type:complete